MKFNLLFASALLCGGPLFAANDWLIQPGVRIGPIVATTTEKDLGNVFGAANVVSCNIDVGEGMSEPGTCIFPNSNKSLSILWKNTQTKTGPAYVFINSNPSIWKTKEGVTLGISLKTIERLNGGPIEL